MPWKIEKREKKFCVIKTTDDSVEKCHDSKEKAKAHMRALYANEPGDKKSMSNSRIKLLDKFMDAVFPTEKKSIVKENKSGTYIFKDEDGLWNGVGIVTNNRLDRHEQIITSKAHTKLVDAIDTGIFKIVMGFDMPEIWLWHLEAPIGDATSVVYDDRGFLITAWKQREDDFSTKAHEVLARIQDTLGMSHSFPVAFTTFDKENPNHITSYFPREFTLLPLQKAANWFTGTAAIMFKNMEGFMSIPDNKREWFVTEYGEEFVAELDQRLSLLEQAADAARLPKKELDMPEELEKGQEAVEEVTEAAKSEEVVEEVEAEVEVAAETEEETDEAAEEKVVEEEPKFGMAPTEFILPKEALDEIVAGVKEPFDILLKQMQDMNQTMTALNERVDSLEKEDGEKLTKKAADTPTASLAGLIAQSVVGNPDTQLDHNKERELYRSPDEVTDDEPVLGIGYLDDQIKKQRSGKRVIRGSALSNSK